MPVPAPAVGERRGGSEGAKAAGCPRAGDGRSLEEALARRGRVRRSALLSV